MPNFKTFIAEKIAYLVANFRRNALLLGYDGSPLGEIDLSFDALSDEYLQLEDSPDTQPGHTTTTAVAQPNSSSFLRITDLDLLPFLENLDEEWSGKFSIADQAITD